MATTSNNKKNWVDVYDGFDTKLVGAGLIDPSIYSDPLYAKKKTQTLLIGGMNQITYGFWDNDMSPLIITIGYEPNYNTILAYNLHYVPEKVRHAMVQFIIKSNLKRIKKGQPLIVDYNKMKRVIPVSAQIVRRYKVVGIRVVDTIPLTAWGHAIRGNNKWSGHYKSQTVTKTDSMMKKFAKSVTNFFK